MRDSNLDNAPKWIQLIFPFPFLIGGIALLFIGGQSVIDGVSSSNWDTAEGLIEDSSVVEKTRSGKKKARKSFKPEINYNYTVDGETYRGDRIVFGSVSYYTMLKNSRERSKEWVTKYPEGSTVSVAYSPTDHSHCVLDTGLQLSACFKPVLGIAFTLAGVFLLRSSKAKKQAEQVAAPDG